jgi:2-phospho-L-lactate guanylyltransferase
VRTVAILPVKRFGRAKQRLSPGLAPDARQRLAEAMVADVLAALSEVDLDGVIMVTAEGRAAALAARHGVDVVQDRQESGQSAAAMLGLGRAVVCGAERALLVPGDCPMLDPREVTALLDSVPTCRRSITIVPDRHGTGTNALVLAPPSAMKPSFGPGSRDRHCTLAAKAGVECRVEQVPSLALDIDCPDDASQLRELLGERPGAASNTRAALSALGLEPRPAAAGAA